ncbi:MAG: ArsR/SmtB family transcription factor [Sulfuricella sp.]
MSYSTQGLHPKDSDATRDQHDFSVPQALAALHALGQQTRLSIFRLLINHEPCGMAVSSIAHAIGSPQNTISSHLAILTRAHLIYGLRNGRSIIYRADLAGMQSLIAYLLADCCHGDDGVCATIFAALGRGFGCVKPP